MARELARENESSVGSAAGISKMLADAEYLIQRALRAHELARIDPFSAVEPLSGAAEIWAMVRQYLAELPDRPVDVGYVAGFAGAPRSDVRLPPLEEQLLESPALVRTLVGGGSHHRGAAPARHYGSLVRHRADVRVLDQQLPLFAVVDRAMVVIRSEGAPGGGYLAVSDPHVARLAGAMFDALFEQGVGLSDSEFAPDPDSALDDGSRAVRVLNLLDAGHTDEVAARQLGVSVRTYRRYVAHLMDQLGVSSRFQAGARAAALKLIPSCRVSSGA